MKVSGFGQQHRIGARRPPFRDQRVEGRRLELDPPAPRQLVGHRTPRCAAYRGTSP
jgi:hypothetical protein